MKRSCLFVLGAASESFYIKEIEDMFGFHKKKEEVKVVELHSICEGALLQMCIRDRYCQGNRQNNRRLPRIICRCFIPAVRIIERVR